MSKYGRVFYTADGWLFDDGSGGGIPGDPSSLRPLVVIDPEDREQVAQFMTNYEAQRGRDAGVLMLADNHRARVTAAQAALRSLVIPPKPEEPLGLGAVVEDAAGERFVRWKARGRADRHWKGEGDGDYRSWPTITAVKVLSEGVTA